MKAFRTQRSAAGGFTLIELLVVITILGILAGVVTFSVVKHVDQARVVRAKLQIAEFKAAVQKYCIDTGKFPTTEEGLKALRERPSDEESARSWKGPYLEEEIPLDPWHNAYEYTYDSDTDTFEIISLGKDRTQGGEGTNADISSRRLSD